MIIALPLTDNQEFSPHFGAAARAGLVEVNPATKTIVRAWSEVPPFPEPCSWVDWLSAQGVSVLLAGGMGRGAQERMMRSGIEVVVGVPTAEPQILVGAWLAGALPNGKNACKSGHHHEAETKDPTHAHPHSGDCGCSHSKDDALTPHE